MNTHSMKHFRRTILGTAVASAMVVGCGGSGDGGTTLPWTNKGLAAEQRAQLLIANMTLDQKMQQLTGANPEILPDLPQCYGARHVTGIKELKIPTFRITNGPVGVGQNDCVDPALANNPATPYAAYADASSAKATALPSAMAAAASFDPSIAGKYGEVIATEMNNLALHEFEAPGMNVARLPILGRNFEYFGEDPYLSGTMSVAEIRAVQNKGLIAMAKHYVGNEQETNRTTIQETIDRQALHEIYLLPFEMSVKDGEVASVMCAYNYVNGVSSCENKETLTDVLRTDWGFKGYVQSDFFATKSTVATLLNGMDFMMPTPQQWAPDLLKKALEANQIKVSDIDIALNRRYTQMFKYGIMDRELKQTPIDFAAGGVKARDIGVNSAVLLQNPNNVLPFAAPSVKNVILIGKASQVYAQNAVVGGQMVGQKVGAGGGSSDVVPNYTVLPLDGIKNALASAGNASATVKLILVNDTNAAATIDGIATTFDAVKAAAAAADAVIVMAGTISEEGADRVTFADSSGKVRTDIGDDLDWYVHCPNSIGAADGSKTCSVPKGVVNNPTNSHTVEMIKAIQAAAPNKTALVLKDNAGVAMDPALVGANGPAILEVWFPGQEDGNIVADLVFGRANPSGKLPVTFPFVGKGFLDSISTLQFPGNIDPTTGLQTVEYTEKLNIGYRWYDANNVTPAFAFGHGLSYTTFSVTNTGITNPSAADNKYYVNASVANTGAMAGSEVMQVYVSLPPSADNHGDKQPPKRLVGFQKVRLDKGVSADVSIAIDPAASNHPLSVWDKNGSKKWVRPAGTYTVYVGNSSSNLEVAGTFTH
ncbi:MAG: glycoside hydrolase family 3 C-terminal domain-containing protein [Burkholderiales bacterium]